MSIPQIKRKKLVSDSQRHATLQANGDYYFNEDTNTWGGELAEMGEKREKSIIKRIKEFCKTDEIPDFITYEDDPRGFVFKILSDRLTGEEKDHVELYNFQKDWGGDYTIIEN